MRLKSFSPGLSRPHPGVWLYENINTINACLMKHRGVIVPAWLLRGTMEVVILNGQARAPLRNPLDDRAGR